MKIWSLFSKEENKNSSIIEENICTEFVEKLEVFIYAQAFLKLYHFVLNTKLILVWKMLN